MVVWTEDGNCIWRQDIKFGFIAVEIDLDCIRFEQK
jgi:hypothetical protein